MGQQFLPTIIGRQSHEKAWHSMLTTESLEVIQLVLPEPPERRRRAGEGCPVLEVWIVLPATARLQILGRNASSLLGTRRTVVTKYGNLGPPTEPPEAPRGKRDDRPRDGVCSMKS